MRQFLKPVMGIVQILFAVFLIFSAVRIALYHSNLVTFPFPNSFREGAMMTSTNALVNGHNPFDMSLQPQMTNAYGIVYPLFVWPLAKIFGATILIHRIVTALFILSSCLLIFLTLKRLAVPLVLNMWAVLMLYASWTFPATSTPVIDPGATGMLFMLLTVLIPWFFEYSYNSLIISILCGIIAFYTKMYDFLGALIILSYVFLFVSKIKSLFYFMALLVLSVISIIVVNQILPAYFDNCFFSSLNMTPSWSSAQRLHQQIIMYIALHQWTLILTGVLILGYCFKLLKDRSVLTFLKDLKNRSLGLNIHDLRAPLLRTGFPLILFAGIWAAAALYISLGRHSGAFLWYFFQLLSPFFLIAAVWLFSRKAYWPLLCTPFLVLNLLTMTADQNRQYFARDAAGWPEISMLINGHDRILNTPLIAPLLIEQNKEIFDNGQSEYFLSGGDRPSWMKNIFKQDDRVSTQEMLFFENIRTRVENKEFDLIIMQPSLMPMGVGDDIRKNYKFEGQLMVYVPQDRKSYGVTVWKPF